MAQSLLLHMLAMAKRRGVRIAVEAAPANRPAVAWNDGGAKGIDPYSPDTAVNIIRGYNLSPRGGWRPRCARAGTRGRFGTGLRNLAPEYFEYSRRCPGPRNSTSQSRSPLANGKPLRTLRDDGNYVALQRKESALPHWQVAASCLLTAVEKGGGLVMMARIAMVRALNAQRKETSQEIRGSRIIGKSVPGTWQFNFGNGPRELRVVEAWRILPCLCFTYRS
jgi:hypothetical protein